MLTRFSKYGRRGISPSLLPKAESLPKIPRKIDVSEYQGYSKKLNRFFEEDFFPDTPDKIEIKPNTHNRGKDHRWRNREFNSYRNEKELFQSVLHEIETIDVDEYINCINHIIQNSRIVKDHVDVIYEFNKDMFAFKQDLYLKVKKISNPKYRIILTNKLHALWQQQ